MKNIRYSILKDLNMRSILRLLATNSFFALFLRHLILDFALLSAVFGGTLLFKSLLFDKVLLAIFNLENSFLSECLLIFGFGCLELLDGLKCDTLDGSFSLENFLLLLLARIVLIGLSVQSSPGGCPLNLLSFYFSE
jgi:hypothetical protein